MLGKVRNISKLVEEVLSFMPNTRDSDQDLILNVWSLQGIEFTIKQREQIRRAASPESIRRTRQKLQEQGKYLGQPKVKQERYLRSLEMQQAMPAHQPVYVEPEDLPKQFGYDAKTNTMRMF